VKGGSSESVSLEPPRLQHPSGPEEMDFRRGQRANASAGAKGDGSYFAGRLLTDDVSVIVELDEC